MRWAVEYRQLLTITPDVYIVLLAARMCTLELAIIISTAIPTIPPVLRESIGSSCESTARIVLVTIRDLTRPTWTQTGIR